MPGVFLRLFELFRKFYGVEEFYEVVKMFRRYDTKFVVVPGLRQKT